MRFVHIMDNIAEHTFRICVPFYDKVSPVLSGANLLDVIVFENLIIALTAKWFGIQIIARIFDVLLNGRDQ